MPPIKMSFQLCSCFSRFMGISFFWSLEALCMYVIVLSLFQFLKLKFKASTCALKNQLSYKKKVSIIQAFCRISADCRANVEFSSLHTFVLVVQIKDRLNQYLNQINQAIKSKKKYPPPQLMEHKVV